MINHRHVIAGCALTIFAHGLAAQSSNPTGQQRANESRADRAGEFDVDSACQRAHAYHPAPANLRASVIPTDGPTGAVSLQWTPVPGLGDSVSYVVEYEIHQIAGSDASVRATLLPHSASSVVVSKVPVYYPVKFEVATYEQIRTPIRLSGGGVAHRLIACEGTAAASAPMVLTTSASLDGFVDLHTHPLSNLAFGGKLLYGGVDVGSLLPADPDCFLNVRATSEAQALAHDKSVHGGIDLLAPQKNPCGDMIREQLIHGIQTDPATNPNDPSGDARGWPDFVDWPKWNDLTHQKMWVDWIRRAHRGGLRAMVALATNNKTLGDMTAGPGDYPTDDKSSADLQIDEIKKFVGRHRDFMEIAYNSADLYRIVSAGKLAVIIGVEIDHIGNFGVGRPTLGHYVYPSPPPDADVRAEIDRLYGEGVRYMFPIHLLDNAFGGTAAYISLLDASNVRESGHPWDLVCATDRTDTEIRDTTSGGFNYSNSGLTLMNRAAQLGKTGFAVNSIATRACPPGVGQKNRSGLTHSGVVAINEMMRHGILIDIDHMSQRSADSALQLAAFAGYPMNSGHNAVRGATPKGFTERSLRPDQYAIMGRLHGMIGVGSARLDAPSWIQLYGQAVQAMGGSRIAGGFGTDMNGLEFAMPPSAGAMQRVQYTGSFPPDTSGTKVFYYWRDGVAHYGILWDFMMDVKSLNPGTYSNLMTGADYLFHTWQIAEGKAPQIM